MSTDLLTDQTPKTFQLGGETAVRRLGFGAMRITGQGVWGEPADPERAKDLLRAVVEAGVNLIDTADAYGPEVSERLIGETLAPYRGGVVIATKGGLLRDGPGQWRTCGRPDHLEAALKGSLARLELDQIALYQLHAIDDDVPLADSVGALAEMQRQGKIRHVGLSNVTVDEIKEAQTIVEVVTVQNRYNLTDRKHEPVLEYCEQRGIGFIPWFPLATGDLAREGGAVSAIANARSVRPSQVALAWLLQRSPVMPPIPGTSSIEHFHENMQAESLTLTAEEMNRLSAS